MFDFIKLQYQMKNITAEQVEKYAAAGWITAAQVAEIISEDLVG